MSSILAREEAFRRRLDEAAMRNARRAVVERARQAGRPTKTEPDNDNKPAAA